MNRGFSWSVPVLLALALFGCAGALGVKEHAAEPRIERIAVFLRVNPAAPWREVTSEKHWVFYNDCSVRVESVVTGGTGTEIGQTALFGWDERERPLALKKPLEMKMPPGGAIHLVAEYALPCFEEAPPDGTRAFLRVRANRGSPRVERVLPFIYRSVGD